MRKLTCLWLEIEAALAAMASARICWSVTVGEHIAWRAALP